MDCKGLTIKSMDGVKRLNYIGSKFRLLEWLEGVMRTKTGWDRLAGKRIADLFGGTGIVSHHFRLAGATVLGNDAELYSSVIVHALTCSVYTQVCKVFMTGIMAEIALDAYKKDVGFITQHYSPYDTGTRKFFTVDNARRIDYIRRRIEACRHMFSADEYAFLVASLIVSADAVSNVPAVYGCFLKNFKERAIKSLTFEPIHKLRERAASGSVCYHSNVLAESLLNIIEADAVYLDPPYNERQYSKNYFPLNIIAMTPLEQCNVVLRNGVTGIPEECFMSPFCKKGEVVTAFDTLFRRLRTQWIFLSYNSESLISKDDMLTLMRKYGEASMVEMDYKRFKSYEYNTDTKIKEYIFCLRKT